MILDKNHEKHLASFEAQGHAAGLNVEPATLTARARPYSLRLRSVPARFKRRKEKTIKNT